MTRYLTIDYTNYRGERAKRVIEPVDLVFKSTLHHPQIQWLMVAIDVKRSVQRDFALAGIHEMRVSTRTEIDAALDGVALSVVSEKKLEEAVDQSEQGR